MSPNPTGPYRAHEQFIAPARDGAPWRVIPGIVLICALYLSLLWFLQAALATLLPPPVFEAFRSEVQTGETAIGALYLLFSFGLMAVAVMLVTVQMHRRSPLGLFGPLRQMVSQGGAVLVMLIILTAVIWILPPSEFPSPLPAARPFASWAVWLPLAIPALLIQTTTEELVFRGYLQQHLAAHFRHPSLWMGLPALLFGLLHYRPEAGENAWMLVLWAAAFSLIAADLTARAGTLGPAIALHFASNAVAILLVSQDPALSGLALIAAPVDLADPAVVRPALLLDVAVLLLGWLTARLVLRR